MQETELYAPVKELLESMGYEVKGEVLDCDVLAKKDGELLAVELKLHLNLDVIVQATLRQKIADKVFIAVPSPKRADLKRRQNIAHLLRRLEIGLITVKESGASVTFDAVKFDRQASVRRSKKTRDRLTEEFSLRHGDNNTGGTNGKNITVYRERAILIAALIQKYGILKTADLPTMTGNPKANSIIKSNYYGWYQKKDKFYISLTEKGEKELEQYKSLSALLIKEVEEG